MADIANALVRVTSKAAARKQWEQARSSLYDHLEPLLKLHLGRTKKDRNDWAKMLCGFTRAAKGADAARLQEDAKSLESHDTIDGIDGAAGAVLMETIDGKTPIEINSAIESLPDDAKRRVRVRVYQFAVAFTNNFTPPGAAPALPSPVRAKKRVAQGTIKKSGGRPEKWANLLKVHRENADDSQADIVTAYNKRFTRGPRATVEKLQQALAYRDRKNGKAK